LKKHLSVLMLMSRGTIFKILPIILAVAIIQICMFCFALDSSIESFADVLPGEQYPDSVTLDGVFHSSHIEWVFLAAFLGISALIMMNGCNISSKQGLTLQRLRISERSVFIWQAVYNSAVYFILLVSELITVLIMCVIYTSKVDVIGPQTVFLAFYRADLPHSLLPLAEISRTLRNIFLVIGLGITTAFFPYKQRRGGISKCAPVLAALTVVNFISETGGYASDFIIIVFSMITVGVSLFGVYLEEEDYEDD